MSIHDRLIRGDAWTYGTSRVWQHICWGEPTPAHVGEHQARGAPDFGVLVPLCKAAHRFYDELRSQWQGVTGYSESQMASAAAEYAADYVEQGGAAPSPDPNPKGLL